MVVCVGMAAVCVGRVTAVCSCLVLHAGLAGCVTRNTNMMSVCVVHPMATLQPLLIAVALAPYTHHHLFTVWFAVVARPVFRILTMAFGSVSRAVVIEAASVWLAGLLSWRPFCPGGWW